MVTSYQSSVLGPRSSVCYVLPLIFFIFKPTFDKIKRNVAEPSAGRITTMKNKPVTALIILLFHVLALLGYHVFGYTGHYGFDDLHYARLSNDLLHGVADFSDHFTFRFTLLALTALSYKLLGISDLASSFPALVITLIILVVIYRILKDKGSIALSAGLSITLFSSWFIFYAGKLMPDIYVALPVVAVVAVVYHQRHVKSVSGHVWYAILFTALLLLGFMAKETIVLAGPLLLYYLVSDWMVKRNRTFWMAALASGFLMLTGYFLAIRLLTGDWMQRFMAIAGNSYVNLCSYDQQSTLILLRRISYEFFAMSLHQSLLTGFLFVVPLLFRRNLSGFVKQNEMLWFYAVSALILLLSSNFMSISLTSYSPMCLDPRHYLFLIPVASIPAALVISGYVREKHFKTGILLSLYAAALISLFTGSGAFRTLYLPLSILFTMYLAVKPVPVFQKLFMAAFTAILMIQPLQMVRYARQVGYADQKALVVKLLADQQEDCVVVTDPVQKRLGEYYSGFSREPAVVFRSFEEFDPSVSNGRKQLLLLNGYTQYLSGMQEHDLPYYARHISSGNRLIREDNRRNIRLYEMLEFSVPGEPDNLLLHTSNGFEEPLSFWSWDENDLTGDIHHAGSRSAKVVEFSPVFSYPLDSIPCDSLNSLWVGGSVQVRFDDRTDAKVVVSVDGAEGTYIWKALDVNSYIKAYSNWWPVPFEFIIPCHEIKENSWLKVYLWNTDGKSGHIDDFEVTLAGVGN